MNWVERLEKKISEIPLRRQCQKCQKPQKHPFGTFGTPAHRVFQKNNSEAVKRFAYRFRLVGNEGGGTYLTNEPSLNEARASLADLYGTRLAVVVEA